MNKSFVGMHESERGWVARMKTLMNCQDSKSWDFQNSPIARRRRPGQVSYCVRAMRSEQKEFA